MDWGRVTKVVIHFLPASDEVVVTVSGTNEIHRELNCYARVNNYLWIGQRKIQRYRSNLEIYNTALNFFFNRLLNNSVFLENDSSFQVKVLILWRSAALQKAQRLLHLCLCCWKWQTFRKEAQIEINDLQLMIRCYLSPDSKKSVVRGWGDNPPSRVFLILQSLSSFYILQLAGAEPEPWIPLWLRTGV